MTIVPKFTTRLLSSTSILLPKTTCSESARPSIPPRRRSTHKGKVERIPRRSLDQKLVPPAIQGLKALGVVDIVYQNAAVGTSIKGHAQGLESFLSGGIPELKTSGG